MNSRQSLAFAIAIIFSCLSVAAEHTSDTALAPLAAADMDSSVCQKVFSSNDNEKACSKVLLLPTAHVFSCAVAAANESFVTARFSNSPPIRSPPYTS